jgi:hypothetical protein
MTTSAGPDRAAPESIGRRQPAGTVPTQRQQQDDATRIDGSGPRTPCDSEMTAILPDTFAVPKPVDVPVAEELESRPAGSARRSAVLQVKHISPWSAFKLALVLGLGVLVLWMVALVVLYVVLRNAGLVDRLNDTYHELIKGSGDHVGDLTGLGGVLAVGGVVGIANTLLFALLATMLSFVYNFCAELVGGIDLTLSERKASRSTATARAGGGPRTGQPVARR